MQAEAIQEHPALNLVPNMRPQEYEQLKADIAERGIQVPVELGPSGRLVDGRHRVRAAGELDLDVPVRTVETADEEEYLLKAAVLRRHLTDEQRAMLAARWKAENKVPDGVRRGASVEPRGSAENTRDKAQSIFRVKDKALQQATQVLRAAPDLAAQVASGEKRLEDPKSGEMRRSKRFSQ